MLINFFLELREARIPVSLREYLTLLEAMQQGLADYSVDDFYYLSRSCLVKDETNLDKFDRVFSHVFKGLEQPEGEVETREIPAEWLKKLAERTLTDEEKALVKSLGGWEKLMETLAQRLREQKGRHQGGSKWIGTAGTSPFGHGGYNPEGIRIGGAGGQRRAVKVWEKRDYRNLDDQVELVVDGDDRQSCQRGLVQHESLRVGLAGEGEDVGHAVVGAQRVALLLARQDDAARVAALLQDPLDVRVALPVSHDAQA